MNTDGQERLDNGLRYSRVLSLPYRPKLSIGVPKEFVGVPQFSELATGQYLDHGRRGNRNTLGVEGVDMDRSFLLLSANCDYGS